MVFHWSFSKRKSSQVSRTLLSILADLNNVVAFMVSTCSFISKSSRLFASLLGIVPSDQITIGITAIFMVHSLFNSLVRTRYISLFLLSFNFTLWSPVQQSLLFGSFSFFFFLQSLSLFVWPRLGHLLVSQNTGELCSHNSSGLILVCA